MLKNQYNIYGVYGLLFITLYFVFFQHLDNFHLRNWDESMFAVNAYEMSNNHNYIVPFYKNLPDMWNSKPPLQIWFQVLFIKLIGYNEIPIRLPSALASSFSALLLFFFFKKRTSLILALCVFFVFVSSGGVSSFHSGRTGDADALLSFFMLCYCLFFYKWLIEKNEKSLFYFFIFLTLAFLTKSIAALLFLPAILSLVLYFKKTKSLFTSKWFYLGSILCLSICIGFVLLRESQNKGYIDYIFKNDINRISNIIESHDEPFDFYINNLFNYRFSWFLLALPGFFLLWFHKKHKQHAIFLILLFISYFLIISISKTKLEWYDLPLFPLLSVFSGYVLYNIYSKTEFIKSRSRTTVFLLLTFSVPCYFAFRNAYKSEINPAEKKLEALTEYAFKNSKNNSLNHTIFLTVEYDRALYFYKYMLNTKGLDFKIINSIDSLNDHSIVIVTNDSLKSALIKKFDIQIIDSSNSAVKFNIIRSK